MHIFQGACRRIATASAIIVGLTGSALADGYSGSVKDAPAEEGRKFSWSITVGGTSEYVFRGISQTLEDPAAQGSIDFSYGIFYTGVWGTNVDFGGAPDAVAEVDWYGGIKPTWGPVTFDFGWIWYMYPGADKGVNATSGPQDLDFVELKAGYSLDSPWIKGLTTGTTVYWSPDYSLSTGDVITVETTASYTLPQMGIFTPSISGTFASVWGDNKDGFSVNGDTEDEYNYWNAGLSLAVEKFTFDFRYWDTDIDAPDPGVQKLVDERFVFSAKVTLP